MLSNAIETNEKGVVITSRRYAMHSIYASSLSYTMRKKIYISGDNY